MEPDFLAEVLLYVPEAGGRRHPALPGFRCPCNSVLDQTHPFRDAQLLLEEPLYPGQRQRVGFKFLTPEGAAEMLDAGTFYLWDGRFIGEATATK